MKVFYIKGGQPTGPVSEEELRILHRHGAIADATQVWVEGTPDWQPYSSVFSTSPSAAPPPLPSRPSLPASAQSAPSNSGVVISAGLLCAAFAFGIWPITRLFFPEDTAAESSMVGLAVWLCMLASFLLAGAGMAVMLVMGFRRRMTPVGFLLSGLNAALALAWVTIGSTLFTQQMEKTMSEVTSQVRTRHQRNTPDPSFAQGMDIADRTIPSGPEAVTRKAIEARFRSWFERNWLESWKQHGRHDPRWDEDGEKLARAWIEEKICVIHNITPTRYFELSERILQMKCPDPLLTYFASRAQPSQQYMQALTQNVWPEIQELPYPAVVKAYVCWVGAGFLQGDSSQKQMLNKWDEQADRYLALALKDGSFRKGEGRMLEEVLQYGVGENYFHRRRPLVIGMLESSSEVDPWVLPRLRSGALVDEAWRARGNGFANTVSKQGWDTFFDRLHKAEIELTQAWELAPQETGAAAAMVTVANGLSDEAKLGLWFDRCMASQMDFGGAYHQLMWALRPRWHGSHEAMLALGEKALNTGRFDTFAPLWYRVALEDIRSELEENKESVYRRPGVYANLRRMYEGYLQQPSPQRVLNAWRTEFALISSRAGEDAQARDLVENLKGDLDARVVQSFGLDPDWFALRIAAKGSPRAKKFVDRDLRPPPDRVEQVLASFKAAKEDLQDDPPAAAYVEARLHVLKQEKLLHSGEWVSWLPDSDLVGWSQGAGAWKFEGSQSISVQTGVEGYSAAQLSNVGNEFEVEGEFAVSQNPSGDYHFGLFFGSPGDWVEVRWVHSRAEGESIVHRLHFQSTLQVAATVPANGRFRLRLHNGVVSLDLNDKTVLRNWALDSKYIESMGQKCVLGLGVHHDQNPARYVYRNVRVRQL